MVSRSSAFRQRGGDTVHMEQLARALQKLGHEVHLPNQYKRKRDYYDIVHYFNLDRLPVSHPRPRKQRRAKHICSSIYIEYPERLLRQPVLKALHQVAGKHGFQYFKTIGQVIKGQEKAPRISYWLRGQSGTLGFFLNRLDGLIFASHAEATLLHNQFDFVNRERVIHLGYEHLPIAPDEGVREGVFCAARFEPLKNQLALIEACRKLQVPLRLAGKPSRNHQNYFETCKQRAEDCPVEFLGELSPDELAREYARCKVHALPSYFETTGLSTVEALASGAQAVTGDHPIQKELFGGHSHCARPDDVDSLCKALEAAFADGRDHRHWVKRKFSWQVAAERTEDFYHQLILDL
mgnify:CR=1 FL=1